jgi:RND family efflux transporter MFP subunit
MSTGTRSIRPPVLVPGLLTALLAVASLGGSSSCGASEAIEAVTRPSRDVELSFLASGRVRSLHVAEGDRVSAGDTLAQQDDEAERLDLAQLEAEAENTTRVRIAEAELERKRAALALMEEAARGRAASTLELEEARLSALVAELNLELERFRHLQAGLRYKEAEAAIRRMTLTSPLDGEAEELYVEEGEAVQALQRVVRVVQTAPLWIDVPVPMDRARRLQPGLAASVRYTEGSDEPVTAGIIHVSAVGDAASETLMVRVAVPNGGGRPAGERVWVTFAEEAAGGEAGAGRDTPDLAGNAPDR